MENNNFCTNCGKRLNGEKFCPDCGKAIDSNTVPSAYSFTGINGQASSFQNILRIVGMIASILAVFSLFGKWIFIDLGNLLGYFGIEGNFNVFDLFLDFTDTMKNLDGMHSDSQILLWVYIFSIILFVLGILVLVYSIFDFIAFCKGTNIKKALNSLSDFVIAISAFTILGVLASHLYIYMAFDEYGYGQLASYVYKVIGFTPLPVIVLVSGILLKVLVYFDKTPQTNTSYVSQNIQSSNTYSEKLKTINNQMNEQKHENKLLNNGGWTCKCGKVNPHYTGTCSCGHSKWNN